MQLNFSHKLIMPPNIFHLSVLFLLLFFAVSICSATPINDIAGDRKLRLAEINKMEISVSQDGSGDFTTLGDAINAIPLYNTRIGGSCYV